MSYFWTIYIIIIVGIMLGGCSFLIYFTKEIEIESVHTYDGIEERNEPLPRWWLWMFILSIIFAVGYLICYPGIGKWKGILDWTSQKACDEKIITENKLYEPLYKDFAKRSVEDLSGDVKALKVGRSLFINNCSLCHGIGAKGGNGFPNLSNNKWLYGGTPENIKLTITNGRRGLMPALGSIIGGNEEIESVALYVLSLSDNTYKSSFTEKGKVFFNKICAACHGINAKGNKFLGSPDLTDPQWIYGGTLENIKETIIKGRKALMPAHKDILTKEQIHLLTSYIYSLNR